MGSSRTGHPARQQGLQTPPQTQQRNREEKDWLTHNVNFNTYFTTAIPLMGWKFDFSDVLRPYLVCQYGRWSEYQAADKTALRNVIYDRIDNIVELQNGNRQ